MNKESLSILNKIAQAIYDKKGLNILALEIKGLSNICDDMIIAEGNVDRHVIAIADAIVHDLKKEGVRPLHVEGVEGDGEWVVLDYGPVHVHLFTPVMREKYRLETLWSKGEVIDLQIETFKREESSKV